MLYFITGAEGSGKSACLLPLRRKFPLIAWYDFDEVGVPSFPTTAWRQRTTNFWVERALHHQHEQKDTGICGQAVLGEILACPSAPLINSIAVCFLDCGDLVRVDRMRAQGRTRVCQAQLNWASWQRMHIQDPQWEPDTIRDQAEPWLLWERWQDFQQGDPRWSAWVLDTTALSLSQVIDKISVWMALQHKNSVRV